MLHHATAPGHKKSGPADPGRDLGGSAIERSLRLGGAAIGHPLAFTEAGSYLDDKLGDHLPGNRVEPVTGEDGATFGSLRVVDFAPNCGFFGAREANALADVAALIANEFETAARIAQTDHVSGLPNRKRFEAAFPNAAAAVGQDGQLILVTLADARHYNELLRALGHACAEDFVRVSAAAIRRAIGSKRALFQVSVLSLAFFAGDAEAEPLARDIAKAFTRPLKVQGLPISTSVGVGLTSIEGDALRPAEVLRSALAAAQDSRRSADGYARYDRRSDEAHLRAFTLLTDLGPALHGQSGLSMAYQPRIDLGKRAIIGSEALVRWSHPTLGPVSPAEFVPLAETTALMGDLTRWVMRKACRRAAAWRAEGLALKTSINVSPTDLRGESLLGDIDAIFRETGVDPQSIEFEFTEGVATSTEPGVAETIEAIRAMGVTIAIDDFGTGYSNFQSLSRLSPDVLKLDRSFVQPLAEDLRRRKLLRWMIELCHELDCRVVAEGIETLEVCDALTGWGCDEGQGYYFSRPVTAERFRRLAG